MATNDGRQNTHEREAVQCAREERRRQVAELLLAGLDYRRIARAVGCSLRTVHQDVSAVRREWAAQRCGSYGQLVEQDSRRIDRLQARYWGLALEGDVRAAAIVLKCLDRRAKLLGLDAAQRIEVDANVDVRAAIVTSPEWVALRTAIMQALEGHPAARMSVVEAIGALPPADTNDEGEEDDDEEEEEDAETE
jgi:hypothetical protein